MNRFIAVIAGIGLIAATLAGLALAFVLGLLAAGAMLVARLTGRLPLQPARGAAKSRDRQGRDFRIWNDGRGTIIDM